MKLCVIGLGTMGAPIARNLIAEGDVVTVSAISHDRFAELAAAGAEPSADPAKAAAGAEILFLCLPNGKTVIETLLSVETVLAPGALVVDLGTSAHDETMAIAARLAARSLRFVDAPISGMKKRAEDGTLTVMCGGSPADFAAVRPFLERIGETVLHMGPVGSGQLTKLVNQLLFDINAAALGEILTLAVKVGLDPEQVEQVINSGTGRSYASEFFAPRILDGDFTGGYPMGAAYKDLVSAARLSADRALPLPVLAAATAVYQKALLEGHADKDKGAMILPYEDALGVRFRRAKGP